MNWKDLGLAVLVIGLIVTSVAGYQWLDLDAQRTRASLEVVMSGRFGSTTSTELRHEQLQRMPWIIGGGITILFGIGIMFAARGQTDSRICPQCAETVRAQALVCKHCGMQLDSIDPDYPGDHSDDRTEEERSYSYRALAKAAEEAERRAKGS